MPTSRIRTSVDHNGPVFSVGQTRAAGRVMQSKINERLAKEGVQRIRTRLGRVLRVSTGFYASKINAEKRGTHYVLTDSDVPKGGWLEGVDPRNRTTRFKGYRTFEIISHELERDKFTIVEPIIAEYVRMLNG